MPGDGARRRWLGAGSNQVVFRYRPFGYPVLLLLSWGTLLGVSVGSVVARRSWRSPSRVA